MPLPLDQTMQAFLNYRSQTNGSDVLYRHPSGIHYTRGVSILAKDCGAYWLLDAIASHARFKPSFRREPFSVWTLTVSESGDATLEATDGDRGDGPVTLASQAIPYTDFPRKLSPLRLFLENGTLMLPEER